MKSKYRFSIAPCMFIEDLFVARAEFLPQKGDRGTVLYPSMFPNCSYPYHGSLVTIIYLPNENVLLKEGKGWKFGGFEHCP